MFKEVVSRFLSIQRLFAKEEEIKVKTLATPEVMKYASHRMSPYIEGNEATFFYYGNQKNKQVELVGELTGWHSSGLKLKESDNKLYHLTLELPTDSRLEYKFVIDGHWVCDPMNDYRVENGIGGQNSFFFMSDYQSDPNVKWDEHISHGHLDTHLFQGSAISGPRRVYVYTPPDYNSTDKNYPVLYAHDGGDYIHRAKLHWVLDNMIAEKLIQPMIAVFVDPRNRFSEYTMNHDYAHMMVEEIVPFIDQNYRTKRFPQHRTLIGASLGGLISTFIAYHYSHVFQNVLGQSSSYQFFSERMVNTIQNGKYHPISLYLTAGRFEGLIGANRRMEKVLKKKGYTFYYSEMNEGHNWTNWAHNLSDGLKYFFGANKDH